MAEVDSGVPEAYAGYPGSEVHRSPRFDVVGTGHSSIEILLAHSQRMQGPNVGDGIRTLVSRAKFRIGRGRARIEWNGRVAFHSMAQDVETGKSRYHS